MKYSSLGHTGVQVSKICLGGMQFGWTADEKTAHEMLSYAYERGVNFVDTADIYSRWVDGNKGGESEKIIGTWIRRGSVRREDVIIATKVRGAMGDGVNQQGLSRSHLIRSVDNSLRRLQTDYIDLYQLHWPDENTPLEETLSTLNDLVRAGKIRHIGCSNFPAWLVMKALWISDKYGWERFATVQTHYNYVHRAEFEAELQPMCADQNLGGLAYSPLAGGYLSGKYRPDQPLPNSVRAEKIHAKYIVKDGWNGVNQLQLIADDIEVTVAQVAIAWVMYNKMIDSVLVGANSIQQLDATLQAVHCSIPQMYME